MFKNYLKLALCATVLAGASILDVQAQNGTNPIADYYNGPEGYPAWTREIKWENTINMGSYTNGANDFEKFESARDELYAQGGGVLYYPAGTYTFSVPSGPNGRGLMLKKGVVIVGDRPAAGDDKAVPSLDYDQMEFHGLNNMPTKFVFEDTIINNFDGTTGAIPKMWNMIGLAKGAGESNWGDISHVGIAWVEIQKGYVYFPFGSDRAYAPTWGESTCWLGGTNAQGQSNNKVVNGWQNRVPDGSHPMDAFVGCQEVGTAYSKLGQKMFAFGVRLTNSMVSNYAIDPTGRIGDGFIETNGWRFGAKLSLNGKNLFIANNVVDKPTASFVTQVKISGAGNHRDQIVPFSEPTGTVRNILFDYGYGIGIDINKSHASFMWNRCAYNDTNSLFYAENIVIRDNWVYNHGNKGYELSGKWVIVKGNVNWRDFHHHRNSPYPNIQTGAFEGFINYSNGRFWTQESVDDHMSRAFDNAGANLWIDQNNYSSTGSNTANDGEGILWQPHNGVDVFSVAVTRNYKDNRPGDSGYIAPYDCDIVGLLQFENINLRRGSVGLVAAGTHYHADLSFINNWNDVARTDLAIPRGVGPGQTESPNTQDFIIACPTGDPFAPDVTVTWDETKKAIAIEWEDRTSNEIGYRIDRKRATDADWTTIAYRPRKETTTEWYWAPSTRGDYGPKPHGCGDITADFNPTKWMDYLTGGETTYQYRVVAINCAEDAQFADEETVTFPLVGLATEVTLPNLGLYPNPAKDHIKVVYEGTGSGMANIVIRDMSGRQIDSFSYLLNAQNEFTINTGKYNKGMYLLEYSFGKTRYKKKMVIE